MKENAIMTLVLQFVTLVLVLLMITMVKFGYDLNSSTSFRQYINYQIEREGGLTDSALDKIANYHDSGMYTFEYSFENIYSSEEKRKVKYGEAVRYTVNISITPLFFVDKAYTYRFSGSASSRVRGGN